MANFQLLSLCLPLAFHIIVGWEFTNSPDNISPCPDSCFCDLVKNHVECDYVGNVSWVHFWEHIPPNVETMIVTNAMFNVIPQGPKDVMFYDLRSLSIQYSDVAFLEPFAFRHTPNLLELDLEYNNLTWINSSHLMPLHDLIKLDLSHNQLRSIEVETFANISQIEELDLSYNNLNNLTTTLFHSLDELRVLDLSHNELVYVHPGSFHNLTNLHTIYLQHNQLDSLHEAIFTDLPLKTTLLGHNPWDCHCGISWLVHRTAQDIHMFPDNHNMLCDSPSTVAQTPITSLDTSTLLCDLPQLEQTPDNLTLQYMHHAILPCNASVGQPQASVYWVTPAGVVVHNSHRRWLPPHVHAFSQRVEFSGGPTYWEASIEALSNGSLRIHNFRAFFSGQYSCVVENPQGAAAVTVQVDIESNIHSVMQFSTMIGYSAAIAWLCIGIVIGALRLCAETYCACCKPPEKPPSSCGDYNEDPDRFYAEKHPYDDIPYMYDFVLRSTAVSSRASPIKCVTPAEPNYDEDEDGEFGPPHLTDDIKELLVAVRCSLRTGMQSGMERVRHGATNVRELSAKQMEQMRERTQHMKERAASLKDNIRQQGSHFKESGSQAIHTMKHSSSMYASRVKAGMAMGMAQMRNHVTSMKEMCGTGNELQQTVSVASIQTDVDTETTTEIVKKITYV